MTEVPTDAMARAQFLKKLSAGIFNDYPHQQLKSFERTAVFEARRALCLELLAHENYEPHTWSDYPILMHDSIQEEVLALCRYVENDSHWHGCVEALPQLDVTKRLLSVARDDNIPEPKRTITLRRRAIRQICKDLHALGTLEAVRMGAAHIGFESHTAT